MKQEREGGRVTVINFKHIQAFVAVADLGTFRRAAERLNTTQPNISNRIAQLEAQLNVVLMERDAGSVRLTPRGRSLLARARAVLGAVDAFVAETHDTSLFEGVLRLGVSEVVAHTWLRDFIVEMRTVFPSVDVELTVDLSANLSKALFERELDLVFQNGPFDRQATATVPLRSYPYAWIASRALDLPDRELSAADLARCTVLTHARGTVAYRQIEEHFRARQTSVRLVPSSAIAACLQMTVDGLGVACLPAVMAELYLGDGRLVVLDYPWTPDALRLAARYILEPAPTFLRQGVSIAQRLSPPEDTGTLS